MGGMKLKNKSTSSSKDVSCKENSMESCNESVNIENKYNL